jgi:hypothetical protein
MTIRFMAGPPTANPSSSVRSGNILICETAAFICFQSMVGFRRPSLCRRRLPSGDRWPGTDSEGESSSTPAQQGQSPRPTDTQFHSDHGRFTQYFVPFHRLARQISFIWFGSLTTAKPSPRPRTANIRIPDLGADGICAFIKYYSPQIRKEALIVEVRGDGGGNISQMLIERPRRDLLGTEFDRTDQFTNTYPAPSSMDQSLPDQ